MNIAVFGVDPGGHTGLAWGVFNPLVDPWESLRTKMLHGTATVAGDSRQQIAEVASLWSSFYNVTVKNACLDADRVWLVVEDFIYTPGTTYGGESSMISTSIIWGIEGYRLGQRDAFLRQPSRAKKRVEMPSMILQSASEAKSFATPARFREADLWERGFAGKNEHIFSAWQHIAFFLKKYRLTVGR